MLNGGLVSWCSKKQPIITLSSTKADYIALSLAAKKATWLCLLVTELGLLQSDQKDALINVFEQNTSTHTNQNNLKIMCTERKIVIPLKDDNQKSIVLAHNLVFYSRTKHIDI